MQFVDDVKNAYKWLSMQASALGAAAMAAWLLLPEPQQKAIIAAAGESIGITDPIASLGLFGFIVVMIVRLKKQKV